MGATVVSACGGSGSSGGFNSDYADFCLLAADLDAQSKGTHGQDPMAISDPSKMKAAWETIAASSVKLRDGAPKQVKDDVSTLVDSILAMNDIFKNFNYNLREMAQVPSVSGELDALSQNGDVAAASERFRTFMQKNCGETAS